MPSNSDTNSSAAKERLVEDVKTLTKDVQELLSVTATSLSGKANEARDRVKSSLKVAQDKLGTYHEHAKAKGAEAAAATDEYVRDNPWNAVGIAAAVGFAVGLIIGVSSFSGRDDD